MHCLMSRVCTAAARLWGSLLLGGHPHLKVYAVMPQGGTMESHLKNSSVPTVCESSHLKLQMLVTI